MKDLEIKCENLIALIKTDIYIHNSNLELHSSYKNLQVPDFLYTNIRKAAKCLFDDKENINKDENQVYFYIDPYKLCYLSIRILIDEEEYAVTLGPIVKMRLTKEEIYDMGYKSKLSRDSCFLLQSFYSMVKYYDQIQIVHLSSLLLGYLTFSTKIPRIAIDDESQKEYESIKKMEEIENFDFVEKNFMYEEKLTKAIKNGDIENISDLFNEAMNEGVIDVRYPGDGLRELKNVNITINTLAVRAAISGGVNYSIAHITSENFILRIEAEENYSNLQNLSSELVQTYAQLVKKYGSNNYSELIRRAIAYIQLNVTEKISLSDVGGNLHVSCEHLSRAFRKEVGVTITDYIHNLKAEEACNLLKSGKYNISEIAYTFGYSSPEHFSAMFKKFVGISPKKWQITNKK